MSRNGRSLGMANSSVKLLLGHMLQEQKHMARKMSDNIAVSK